VRRLNDIRNELEAAVERRAELWDELADGYDAAKSAEAAALSARIEELWAEQRLARARARYGPSDVIITRARAEDRLDREARRFRDAA
jgi:hypothetical protein